MIDLHFHCLPGVDDGPVRMDQAVEMCRLAALDGCSAVVATPHQGHSLWPNTDPAKLRSLLAELQDAVGRRPELYLGGEIRVGSELLAQVDDPLRGGFLPLAESRYLLLELSRTSLDLDPEGLVHELIIAGWRPILAHPEFVDGLADNLQLLERLVAQGAHLQLTAMSLTGEFGRRARTRAMSMLKADLVHFVASDAHGTERRPPGLQAVRRLIAARCGEETARNLTENNPRAVLANLPVARLSESVGSIK